MRSLYWFTAMVLVAAAVVTVAIAEYGQKRPDNMAWLINSSKDKPATSVPAVTRGSSPAFAIDLQPTLRNDTPPATSIMQPPVRPVAVEDVPEHKHLREEALKNLASLQPEPPALPPNANKPPVVDEFTFTEKPLVPLYVPIQPDAKVILPPAKVMQEVAKLPPIPGVSLNSNPVKQVDTSNNFATLPSYNVNEARGPEVMPGLHAAVPPVTEDENPVYFTMQAMGELISAMNPTTYLLSLPIEKKSAATSTNFASPDKKSATCSTGSTCSDKKVCCNETPGNAKASDCCKVGDEQNVIVRTYSIAEFSTTACSNHDELIRLITTMVSPDAWNTKDATIEYFAQGKCLVVRQKQSVQDQVDDLLTQLRGQVLKQNKVAMPHPVIKRELTCEVPVDLEQIPLCPAEGTPRLPRVITDEPNRCVGDDDFFGMIPMTLDGRLMPVPMTLPKLESTSLVPAQFTLKSNEVELVEEGPAMNRPKPKAPEFFPWFLPYAPLPNGPDSYEEQQVTDTSLSGKPMKK